MGKGNNNRQKTRPHMDFGGAVREIGVFVALIIMVIIFALIDPSYVTVGNFVDIVKQATINGILAIGITFAIISGGIDLSLGSTFAIVIVAVGQLGNPSAGRHCRRRRSRYFYGLHQRPAGNQDETAAIYSNTGHHERIPRHCLCGHRRVAGP